MIAGARGMDMGWLVPGCGPGPGVTEPGAREAASLLICSSVTSCELCEYAWLTRGLVLRATNLNDTEFLIKSKHGGTTVSAASAKSRRGASERG